MTGIIFIKSIDDLYKNDYNYVFDDNNYIIQIQNMNNMIGISSILRYNIRITEASPFPMISQNEASC